MELKNYRQVTLAYSLGYIQYNEVKQLLIGDLDIFENVLTFEQGEAIFEQDLYEFLCEFYALNGEDFEDNKNQMIDIVNRFLVTELV